MGPCLTASSSVPLAEGRDWLNARLDGFGPVSTQPCDGSPMTVRGGGPDENHGFDAVVQNGSAASESRSRCASLHHGRVSAPTEYKDVARVIVHHTRDSPRTSSSDHSKCAVVLGAVKDRALQVALTPPILDRSSARRFPRSVWVGMKKRGPGRTKKQRDKKMDRTFGAPP
jgi:hypothetical protein